MTALDGALDNDETDSEDSTAAEKADDIAKFDEDPNIVFAEEKEGWHG
jgi:hypothetical protein